MTPGASWIDRQLLAKDSSLSGGGFGAEVREAMDRRVDYLIEEGLVSTITLFDGAAITEFDVLPASASRRSVEGLGSGSGKLHARGRHGGWGMADGAGWCLPLRAVDQRPARQYPSADLTTRPAAVMAARRS